MIPDKTAAKPLLQKRDQLFGEMPRRPEVIRGTLVLVRRSCGKPRCRCRKDSPHKSLYVSQSHKGKTRMVYVPKRSEEKARAWVGEYHRLKALLNKLSEIHLKLLAEE